MSIEVEISSDEPQAVARELDRILRATSDRLVQEVHTDVHHTAKAPTASEDWRTRAFVRRQIRQWRRYELAATSARADVEHEIYLALKSQIRWGRREGALLTIMRCAFCLITTLSPVAVIAGLYIPTPWHVVPIGLSVGGLGLGCIGVGSVFMARRRTASWRNNEQIAAVGRSPFAPDRRRPPTHSRTAGCRRPGRRTRT